MFPLLSQETAQGVPPRKLFIPLTSHPARQRHMSSLSIFESPTAGLPARLVARDTFD
jgi:hypothetical protein